MKIIKFIALWCADCIVMRPLWREISEKFPQIEVVDIDFDEHPEEAKKFGAVKVPLTIFFDSKDMEIARSQGMQNKADLIKLIEENLDK
jgi:thioredoxin 1